MAEIGLRAHIYPTERSVVEFATRRKRTGRPLERNVGPEPVRRVLAELLRPETEPQSWLRQLHAVAAGRSRVRAPTLWNSPALVVTGAMASRALCAALEQRNGLSGRMRDRLLIFRHDGRPMSLAISAASPRGSVVSLASALFRHRVLRECALGDVVDCRGR